VTEALNNRLRPLLNRLGIRTKGSKPSHSDEAEINQSIAPSADGQQTVSAGEIYSKYILQQIIDEDSRRSSIEQRGLAVVTTTGVLTTALLGVSALVKPSSNHGIPAAAHGYLATAIISLMVAAVVALLTNVPLSYHKVTTDELVSIAKNRDFFREPSLDAMQRIAVTQVKELTVARDKNTTKAALLLAAIGFEILGLSALGYTVSLVISAKPV
jgi:hypothetical protein